MEYDDGRDRPPLTPHRQTAQETSGVVSAPMNFLTVSKKDPDDAVTGEKAPLSQ